MNKQEIVTSLEKMINVVSQCTNNRHDDEIRSWLMAATLRIWAGNKLCAKDYVQVLSVLVNQHYTTAQIVTALNCAGEELRQLNIPDFFKDIVSIDMKNNTSISRDIADTIGRFLVVLALVNGDFTIEEASALREISDLLLDYCNHNKVKAGKEREYLPDLITPLNTTGYYQPLPEKKTEINDISLDLSADSKKMILNEIHDKPSASETESENKTKEKTSASILKAENESTETLESILAELNGLVGLDKVKSDVQSLLNFIKVCRLRSERGMKVPTISYHLVFTGNPGTGKTTVARMVAKLYYLMGILPQGQLIETDRSGLVAGYLGQTAIKTQEVIQKALGGVLFIDEAYSLVNDSDDSYGKEAIETILKAMEDHRDELVVIVAGYDELMHKFIDSNPGLRSRFNKYFNFPDYDGDDLLRILKRFCDTNGYALADESIEHLKERFNNMYDSREEHFGNARAVRNIFEHAINNQANRLMFDDDITDTDLTQLTLEDLLPAMEVM